MFRIKKIDRYVIKSFLTYFIMTLFICTLILLMQFMWKHMADLIGKGIGIDVLFEFFWYAILETLPLALPLAILLASLMSFGNFGEYFELTAMKSAGISLFRIMRGLILFIVGVSIAAFFFSNNVLPISKAKLWTLILSLREKSPEFDIPEGEFYNGLGGYNIYVHEKDQRHKLLKELIIYDFTKGFDNTSITLADSGKVAFTKDNKYLKLSLYNGESFENIKKEQREDAKNIPYRRETFKTKKVLIEFDTEFNRFDESMLKNEYVSKNLSQLSSSIDSLQRVVDRRAQKQSKELIEEQPLANRYFLFDKKDSLAIQQQESELKDPTKSYHPDSLFLSLSQSAMEEAVNHTIREIESMKDRIDYNKSMYEEPAYNKRKHQAQWHRKLTLSIACLIFFFIGAPLGAIVRKGGLGFPIVLSVVFFIAYYIIDTTGYKMAREGFWEVYQGMWLSSVVLLIFGVFLTWKAVTDASLFRSEAYTQYWDKIKRRIKYAFLKVKNLQKK